LYYKNEGQAGETEMTKIEKIQDLLEEVEGDIRKRLIKDILADLRDFGKDAIENEKAGFRAAIEVIEANYPVNP
jgi:hypothetical protein